MNEQKKKYETSAKKFIELLVNLLAILPDNESIIKLLNEFTKKFGVDEGIKQLEKLAKPLNVKEFNNMIKTYKSNGIEFAAIEPTSEQIKEYFNEHGKDLEAMGEVEPCVHIPLIEDESIGFTLWGYEFEKDVPKETRLSYEYDLFCLHHKEPKERKTLELFLNYRIENTNTKELYWYKYKMFLKEKLSEKSPKVKKVFSEYLIHAKREKLGEKLVKEFRKDDSVTIAYMLHILDVKVDTKNQKGLYESMKNEFGFSFSKQSIFDKLRTIEPLTEKKSIEIVSNRISLIINKI